MYYCKVCKKDTIIPHTIVKYTQCKDCKCKEDCKHKPRDWIECKQQLERNIKLKS